MLRRASGSFGWIALAAGIALMLRASPPARAQGYPIWTVDGPSVGSRIGGSVASAGDVDADGLPDVVLGGFALARVHSGASGALLLSLPSLPSATITVAGVGDVNGDGIPEFAIGRPDASAPGSLLDGSVSLHSGATGAALFTTSFVQVGARLGSSIAGPGDVNLDGVPDVVAGGNGFFVTVLSGTNGAILYTLNSTVPQQALGPTVAAMGSFGGSAAPDFVVGSPGFLSFPGPATVRSGANGAVLLSVPPPGPSDFGRAVARAGDLDGDGISDLIVGAPQSDNGIFLPPPGTGLAYAFSGATGASLFTFGGSVIGEAFGFSVAGPGDLDGDGVPDLLVGARQATTGMTGATPIVVGPGYVKAFSGASGLPILTMTGIATGDRFGASLAPAGDPNGDGVPDFILGAPESDPGGLTGAGEVTVASFVGIPPSGTVLGSGCPGSTGFVPRIATSGGAPTSAGNASFKFHLSRALGGTLAILKIGFSSTSWLGIPLPLDLGVFGIPGCFLLVSSDIHVPVLTTAAGRAVVPAPVPSNPLLSGATLYFQWYVVDPGPALLPGA
ncbi:MAG TPA: VCBS repeat-containing protein, partial [Planctomycetota bacterium]|nr:VCBS repeat-containing protein [Planctomycetota bacterium]